jgi:uncharacterized Zn finger protein (UPF0148 family)
MKNIHLLPTDKASRLWLDSDNKLWIHESPTTLFMMQNIYITSDEEIKEGDWFMIFTNKKPIAPTKAGLFDSDCKKIILTTDQDLINDGVQAIDDEFLQWFVKNPSCEYVETELVHDSEDHPELVGNPKEEWSYYDIIIPKEEPKLINNCPKCGLDLVEKKGSKPVCTRIDCGGIIISNETLIEWVLKEEPKQETLEEAVEEFLIKELNMSKTQIATLYSEYVNAVVKFNKMQSERMYTEEEVRKLLETQRGNCAVAILIKTRDEELAAIAGGAPEPSGYNGWVK